MAGTPPGHELPAAEIGRQLATIVIIEQVTKHPGADRLALVPVKGWQVVVQLEEFQAGDWAIYCEIDSILPPEVLKGLRVYTALEARKFIIKTIKLRGEYSQGILLPLSLLDNTGHAQKMGVRVTENSAPQGARYTLGDMALEVGMDVTGLLGVTKHEAPIIALDTFSMAVNPKGDFPVLLMPKTDQERVQNIPHLLPRWHGMAFAVTEKVDGTSFSCYRSGGVFGVCSRNFELRETQDDVFWGTARRLGLEDKLKALRLDDVGLQGELLGPSIQANRYRLPQHTVLFFGVIDLKHRRPYAFNAARALVEERLGLRWVPVVHEAFVLQHTAAQLVALADGKSALNPQLDREGLVFRAEDDSQGDHVRRISFKCISNKFLLKFDGQPSSGSKGGRGSDTLPAEAKGAPGETGPDVAAAPLATPHISAEPIVCDTEGGGSAGGK